MYPMTGEAGHGATGTGIAVPFSERMPEGMLDFVTGAAQLDRFLGQQKGLVAAVRRVTIGAVEVFGVSLISALLTRAATPRVVTRQTDQILIVLQHRRTDAGMGVVAGRAETSSG